ncbi:MAG: class I SAM-dependent methyltransferase [Flavobacteriales bacterium]|nr:class I SAM-dependent methyltransferase [Flavobacteriales bacterium]MCB9446984.1 class I SAM-dependent methyltransferase [Flavobacteriales bacterium]
MKKLVKRVFENMGVKIIMKQRLDFPADMEPEFFEVLSACRQQTMTSAERMYALYNSIRYLVDNGVAGDVVECGVWRGGSSMNAAITLQKCGDTTRNMHLYDTFEGMSAPTDKDISYFDESAEGEWQRSQKQDHNEWCYAPIDLVKKNMTSTGYPADKLHFIKGKVEDTIPQNMPGDIALLRVDTDWYESTYHILKHLYPKVVKNGVVILDDYGYWKGAREATDQFLAEEGLKPLLHRIDATGRMFVKR